VSKSSDDTGDLARAAAIIERHVERLEGLSVSVRKIRLHNEKSIARAARELQEALEEQEHLADGLRLLAEAMVHTQQRQQSALESLAARAVEIQQRTTRMSEYKERFATLGTHAREATNLLQSLSGVLENNPQESAGEKATATETLSEVERRLTAIVDEAKSLAESAQEEDLSEVAKEADALKQRMQAAASRLREFVRDPGRQLN
jgi:chromosome segregation ATPase